MTRPTPRILIGDCRETLKALAPGSVHACVTSPPYWQLRNYGVAGALGNEPTIDEYLANQIAVFREVRRVLRDDGTCWVNLGDTYSGGGRGGNPAESEHRKQATNHGSLIAACPETGLADGNQFLIPHRFALAMQADGWVLRSTIVWAKGSPMPESISGCRWVRCRVKTGRNGRTKQSTSPAFQMVETSSHRGSRGQSVAMEVARWSNCPGCDKCREHGGYILRRGSWRCTTAHEYIFQFAKQTPYFCDGDAVQEQAIFAQHKAGSRQRGEFNGKCRAPGREAFRAITEVRNPRSVWTLSSEPFKERHFATFPSELPYRIIRAATSQAGCCPACGAQYAPVIHRERVPTRPGKEHKIWKLSGGDEVLGQRRSTSPNLDPQRHIVRTIVQDYWPTCDCRAGEPVPATVLDPYMGSGTTLQVASWLGRDSIGCELNPDYAALAEARIATKPRCLTRRAPKPPGPSIVPLEGQRKLF